MTGGIDSGSLDVIIIVEHMFGENTFG